jgi:cyclopropane-fatty-acyl-phospholipid synthase
MTTTWLLDHGLVPEFLIRKGIRSKLRERLEREADRAGAAPAARLKTYASELAAEPIAIETHAANEQHYEVPAAFYEAVLGPHLKYSSGLWREGVTTLGEAEEAMLALSTERAQIVDGQRILDLGCGWGSLSFFLAQRFPNCRILGVSNSHGQRRFIESKARDLGLTNLEIQTCNVNDFHPTERFDRIVSVEMLEHVRNYEALFERMSTWLTPEGRAFVHVFVHDRYAYPFESGSNGSWMGQYFFSGGQMPADRLFQEFPKHMEVEEQWRVSGTHYARTARAWTENLDAHAEDLKPLLAAPGDLSGSKALRRWRIFFLACEELWGFEGGDEWYVSHYRLRPRTS